ncbi:MAG: hypothetical protein QE271_14880 [Bacteriovoracaceae bacterium]|nr:hypothetical protein [Bacteriovoracaceae bacterium]
MKNLFHCMIALNSVFAFSQTLECDINVAVNNTDHAYHVSEDLVQQNPEQVYLSATKQINHPESQFEIKVFAQTTKVGRYLVGAKVVDKVSGIASKATADTKSIELFVENAKAPRVTQMVSIECDVKQ